MKNETRESVSARWFVEPIGPDTNESILAELAFTCGATSENIHRKKMDDKGVPHNVVEIDRFFVRNIEQSKSMRGMCRLYVQESGRSAMRRWAFGGQSNLSRTKEEKTVTRRIEEIKAQQKV